MSLRDASHCLTELAAGRTPERLFVLTAERVNGFETHLFTRLTSKWV